MTVNRRIIYSAPAGGGTDADATLWAAAVVAAGGTVSANQLSYVSTLITAYKAAGVWTLLDREWLYASENPYTAQVDIKGLQSHTLVSAPFFTANRGYDTSASSVGYINTNYTTGANFLLNAHSFGGYVYTSRVASPSNATILGTQSTAYTILQPFQAAAASQVASSDNTFEAFANSQANGNYIVTRTSSSNVNFYKNANGVLSATATSVALPTVNFFALAFNGAGSPTQYYFIQEVVSSVFMGGVLDGTQAAAKNAALNAYMTSVGANVY